LKPNVLFLACEQLYARHLSCYGYPLPTSPSIDKLAQQGMRFENCFVHCPKCAPSRASVVTGRYPAGGGYMKLGAKPGAEAPNLVQAFRAQGYHTSLFRKNHQMSEVGLAAAYDAYHPAEQANPRTDEQFTEPGSHPLFQALYRGEDRVRPHETVDGATAEMLKARLREPRDQPFFMWMSFWQSHPAYKCTPEFFRKFNRSDVPLPPRDDDPNKPPWMGELRRRWGFDDLNEANWRELIATYAGMIAELDHTIAGILDTLEATGQADNTIVVLWADHGEFAGAHQLVEKYDTLMYDCLMHVPLIVRGPGVAAGAVSEAMIESVDLLPTVAELCGVELPGEIHGRSFERCLRNANAAHRDDVIAQAGYDRRTRSKLQPIPENNPYHPKVQTAVSTPESMSPTMMLRTERWKLIYRRDGVNELYDLETDPHELTNRYGQPEVDDTQRWMERRLLDRCLDAWPPVSSQFDVHAF